MTYIIKTGLGYVQNEDYRYLVIGARETAHRFASAEEAEAYRGKIVSELSDTWSVVEEVL